jgi:hypothetical protein
MLAIWTDLHSHSALKTSHNHAKIVRLVLSKRVNKRKSAGTGIAAKRADRFFRVAGSVNIFAVNAHGNTERVPQPIRMFLDISNTTGRGSLRSHSDLRKKGK